VGTVQLVPKGLLGVAHSHNSVGQLGLEQPRDLRLAPNAGFHFKGLGVTGIGAVLDSIVLSFCTFRRNAKAMHTKLQSKTSIPNSNFQAKDEYRAKDGQKKCVRKTYI